jgi:hypothetical protein
MVVGWLIIGIAVWGGVDTARAGAGGGSEPADVVASSAGRDFGRIGDRLRTQTYWTVEGPMSGPMRGKWRNRRGTYRVTSFPDGVIEHFDHYEGRTRALTRTFETDGRAEATIDWPAESLVLHLQPEHTVPFGDWATWRVGGIDWRVPEALVRAGLVDEGAPEKPDLPATMAVLATASPDPGSGAVAYDPFSTDFGTALAKGCGCEVEARMTRWVAGRPAAHYRLQRPDATADVVALAVEAQEAPEGEPAEGEPVVASHGPGLLVLTAAGPDVAALVPLRAILALAEAP